MGAGIRLYPVGFSSFSASSLKLELGEAALSRGGRARCSFSPQKAGLQISTGRPPARQARGCRVLFCLPEASKIAPDWEPLRPSFPAGRGQNWGSLRFASFPCSLPHPFDKLRADGRPLRLTVSFSLRSSDPCAVPSQGLRPRHPPCALATSPSPSVAGRFCPWQGKVRPVDACA